MQIEAIEIRNYRLFRDAKLTDCSKLAVLALATVPPQKPGLAPKRLIRLIQEFKAYDIPNL